MAIDKTYPFISSLSVSTILRFTLVYMLAIGERSPVASFFCVQLAFLVTQSEAKSLVCIHVCVFIEFKGKN